MELGDRKGQDLESTHRAVSQVSSRDPSTMSWALAGHPGPAPPSHLVLFLLLWPLEMSGAASPFLGGSGVTPSGLPLCPQTQS